MSEKEVHNNERKFVCELYNEGEPAFPDIQLLHEKGLRFYIQTSDPSRALEIALEKARNKKCDSIFLENLDNGYVVHSGRLENSTPVFK